MKTKYDKSRIFKHFVYCDIHQHRKIRIFIFPQNVNLKLNTGHQK